MNRTDDLAVPVVTVEINRSNFLDFKLKRRRLNDILRPYSESYLNITPNIEADCQSMLSYESGYGSYESYERSQNENPPEPEVLSEKDESEENVEIGCGDADGNDYTNTAVDIKLVETDDTKDDILKVNQEESSDNCDESVCIEEIDNLDIKAEILKQTLPNSGLFSSPNSTGNNNPKMHFGVAYMHFQQNDPSDKIISFQNMSKGSQKSHYPGKQNLDIESSSGSEISSVSCGRTFVTKETESELIEHYTNLRGQNRLKQQQQNIQGNNSTGYQPSSIHISATVSGSDSVGKPTLVCGICNGKAAGLHSGIVTCQGCKEFCKRTVQSRRAYTCVASGNCQINKLQKNRCQFCRFKKCLNAGIVTSAVRKDRMPGGRNSGEVYNLNKVRYKKHNRSTDTVSKACTNILPPTFGLGEVENRGTGLDDSSRTFGMLQIPEYTSGTHLKSVNGNQLCQNIKKAFVENKNQSSEFIRDPKYTKRTNGLLQNALTVSNGTENWMCYCDDLKARENQNVIVDNAGGIVPEVRRGTIIQHMSRSRLKVPQSQSFVGSKYNVNNSNIAQDVDPNCRYTDSQRKYIHETEQIQFDSYIESEWQRASHSNSSSPSHISYELGKRQRTSPYPYRKNDINQHETVFKNLPYFSNIYGKYMHSVYPQTNTSLFETDQNFEYLHNRPEGLSSPKRQKLIHNPNQLTNPEKAYTRQRLAKENLNSLKSTNHKRDIEQSQPTKFHCLSLIENLRKCNRLLDISNLYQVEKLFQTNTDGVAKILCELGEHVVEQLVLWAKELRFFKEIPIQIYSQLLEDKWHELLVLITLAYKAINGDTNKGMSADELYYTNMEKLKGSLEKMFHKEFSPMQMEYELGSMMRIISNVMHGFMRVGLSQHEYVCLQVILLLNQDGAHNDMVSRVQVRYNTALRDYIHSAFPSQSNRYTELLQCLHQIQMASSLLIRSKMIYIPFLLNL